MLPAQAAGLLQKRTPKASSLVAFDQGAFGRHTNLVFHEQEGDNGYTDGGHRQQPAGYKADGVVDLIRNGGEIKSRLFEELLYPEKDGAAN